MDRNFFERLLSTYQDSYDIVREYRAGDHVFDAYARLDASNARYVLLKKAELWRTLNHEHVFFARHRRVMEKDLSEFLEAVNDVIEPQLIRQGERTMPKDHMSSLVTGIFLSEEPVEPETIRRLRRMKFYRSYSLSFRGFCQGRFVIVDLAQRKVYGNAAARDIVRNLRKVV